MRENNVPANHNAFRHHMLREIFEQPRAIAETARGAEYPEAGILEELLRWPAAGLKALTRIVIAASGSSRHAGIAGKFMIETLAGLPVEVGYSSELQYTPLVPGPNTLFLVITQSGQTADTLGALRAAKQSGCKVIAICNVADAPIMREADARVHTKAGPELAVPSTKTFTAQIAALFLFAHWLARSREALPPAEQQSQLADLMRIPGKLNGVLELNSQCQQLAAKYLWCEDFFFAGRGIHYPIAMDGALKLKEVSYLHAEAFPAGEILHGPLAVVDEEITAVVIATCDADNEGAVQRYERTVSNIKELKSRSAKVIALGNVRDSALRDVADDFIAIPAAPELLLPLLEIIPLQLFAYHTAVLQGREVDRPRNLTKAVVTE
jgi:glucosamine--fructose-6-phosphate aminotransferase (isomerizing)